LEVSANEYFFREVSANEFKPINIISLLLKLKASNIITHHKLNLKII